VRFIGIDLAWSERNPTAALALDGTGTGGKVLGWDDALGDDEWIEAFVTHWSGGGPALVAVDAPLAVPNETGARPVDLAISRTFRRFQAGAYPVNRRRPGGGLRGEGLAKLLGKRGFRLDPRVSTRGEGRRSMEVYPHPAMVSLFGLDRTLKYKARSGRSYRERWGSFVRYQAGLRALQEPRVDWPPELVGRDVVGMRGRALKAFEDLLDAAMCAYIAYYCWYWGPTGYRIFGDPGGAHVVVPLTAWMRERIQTQE
jgi:predicted RNase H-like nuclease